MNPHKIANRNIADPNESILHDLSAQPMPLIREVYEAVHAAWLRGDPLPATGLHRVVRGKRVLISQAVAHLLDERWLHPVEVPAALRVNNSKIAYLVALTYAERHTLLTTGQLPPAKLALAKSWSRAAAYIPPRPREMRITPHLAREMAVMAQALADGLTRVADAMDGQGVADTDWMPGRAWGVAHDERGHGHPEPDWSPATARLLAKLMAPVGVADWLPPADPAMVESFMAAKYRDAPPATRPRRCLFGPVDIWSALHG